jgi:hypothetical protein
VHAPGFARGGLVRRDQSVIPPGSVAPGVPAHSIVTPPFARGGPSRREGGRAQPAKPGRTGPR